MTELEFEAKLSTVSDAKLLHMLEVSLRDGPEIAVKLILSEGKARGLNGFADDKDNDQDDNVEPEAEGLGPEVESAMASAALQAVGHSDVDFREEDAAADAENSEAKAPTATNWLDEENQPNKIPTILKVVLVLAGLGALIVWILNFIQRR